MDATSVPVILVKQLKTQGLSVIDADDQTLTVVNPLNPVFVEAIAARDGLYITSCGYELGQSGDEAGTAHRLAFLLGRRCGGHPRGIGMREEVARAAAT
ncbi:hypothetical protein ACFV2H_39810 [Streptomyces sp. NPDC059629]|uniref:hypothetical protein n=1 Tax=Streptomyces sp. NPDC059629 TaxID=3346889 RepID=UPI003687243F